MKIVVTLGVFLVGLLAMGDAQAQAQLACQHQINELLKIFYGFAPLNSENYRVMHKDLTFSSVKDMGVAMGSPRTAIVPLSRVAQEKIDKAYRQCRSEYLASAHSSQYDKAEKALKDLRMECDIHLDEVCKEKARPLLARMEKSGVSEHCPSPKRVGAIGGEIYFTEPLEVLISGSLSRPGLNLNRLMELKMALHSCEFVVEDRGSRHYFRHHKEAFMYKHNCDQVSNVSYDDQKICEVLRDL